MRRLIPAVVVLSMVLAGCRAKEAFDKISAAKELANKSSVDVMKEAANDKYTPPADGKLTDGQVQMYLKVREHEKAISEAAKQNLQKHADAAKQAGDKSLGGIVEGFKGLSSVADLVTADVRAAKDLHYNTQEYLWVKGQILGASASAMSQKMLQAGEAQMETSYQQMKKQYDEAKDEQSKKVLGEMLASVEKSRAEQKAEQQKEDPALSANRQLLSKYENVLNAYATEAAKYSDKPVDVQKSVNDWNNQMDKAIQDAKKQQQ